MVEIKHEFPIFQTKTLKSMLALHLSNAKPNEKNKENKSLLINVDLYLAVSFIGIRNRSTRMKPSISRNSLINFNTPLHGYLPYKLNNERH